MGNLTTDWIENLKDALFADDKCDLYIMYPTEETVKNSLLGADGGGTIHCQRKFWYSPTFPKNLVRNCKLLSNSLLHSKVLNINSY